MQLALQSPISRPCAVRIVFGAKRSDGILTRWSRSSYTLSN